MDSDICAAATFYQGSKKRFRNSDYHKPFVIEAKRRGLSCGVSSDLSTKPYSKNEFAKESNSTICALATVFENNKRVWEKSLSLQGEVDEAKRRGLSCGVVSDIYASSTVSNTQGNRLTDCGYLQFNNCYGTFGILTEISMLVSGEITRGMG